MNLKAFIEESEHSNPPYLYGFHLGGILKQALSHKKGLECQFLLIPIKKTSFSHSFIGNIYSIRPFQPSIPLLFVIPVAAQGKGYYISEASRGATFAKKG